MTSTSCQATSGGFKDVTYPGQKIVPPEKLKVVKDFLIQ